VRPQGFRRAGRARRQVLIGVCVCAAPLLAACSGAAAQVHLPPQAGPAGPVAVSGPAPGTSRQHVTAALAGYTAALASAEASRDPAQARRLLRPYLAANRIGGLVSAISIIWARGESFYGHDDLHILTVQISGQRAFVHDCDDTSAMGLDYESTGQPVPGTAGVNRANLVTRLDSVHGHWLVESQLPEDLPCVP